MVFISRRHCQSLSETLVTPFLRRAKGLLITTWTYSSSNPRQYTNMTEALHRHSKRHPDFWRGLLLMLEGYYNAQSSGMEIRLRPTKIHRSINARHYKETAGNSLSSPGTEVLTKFPLQSQELQINKVGFTSCYGEWFKTSSPICAHRVEQISLLTTTRNLSLQTDSHAASSRRPPILCISAQARIYLICPACWQCRLHDGLQCFILPLLISWITNGLRAILENRTIWNTAICILFRGDGELKKKMLESISGHRGLCHTVFDLDLLDYMSIKTIWLSFDVWLSSFRSLNRYSFFMDWSEPLAGGLSTSGWTADVTTCLLGFSDYPKFPHWYLCLKLSRI